MTKKKLPVRFTGQHFTIDKVLIKDAIRQANISNQDTVLDIGAGKGFLTVHLLKIANNVVAIENDTIIAKTKRTTFQNETYNFLIFSHLALQSFERRLTTVLVAIKRLLSLH